MKSTSAQLLPTISQNVVSLTDSDCLLDSVSIIIVNYNAGALLTECIALALKQAGEVVIVDNASSDNSIHMVELTFCNNPRLKILKNQKNLGFASACNIGTNIANGKYLLYLNPDSLLQNNTVEKLVKVIDSQPEIGMVGGLLVNTDGSEQGGGRRAVPTPWRSFVRAFGLSRFSNRWPRLFFNYHLHKQPLPEEPIEIEAISGACMMIKRVVMDVVGHWDERYFLHCEDLDLCMRFRQKGWKIVFVPDAPITHYLGICSASRPIFVEWHKHKGMIRFYRKFFRNQYPGALMWLVTIGVGVRFIGTAAFKTARRTIQMIKFVRHK